MVDFLVPHDAWILVGDGRKALFLRNEGAPDHVELKVERVLSHPGASTSAQGSDRPGRAFSSTGEGRSAYENTDWHELEEHRFAGEIAGTLDGLVREGRIARLVLIAPPKTLGDLRAAMSDAVHACVIGELSKDLTPLPLPEIAAMVQR